SCALGTDQLCRQPRHGASLWRSALAGALQTSAPTIDERTIRRFGRRFGPKSPGAPRTQSSETSPSALSTIDEPPTPLARDSTPEPLPLKNGIAPFGKTTKFSSLPGRSGLL